MQVSANGIVYANSVSDSELVLSGTAGALITVLDGVLLTAGYTKVFSGTNKAVYRSDDVTGTRLYLRVDDSTTTYATVVGYESMSTVDAGNNAFNANWYIRKSETLSGSPRAWFLFADSRAFYLFTYWHSGYLSNAEGYWFGDIVSNRVIGDVYGCGIIASTVTSSPYPGGNSAGHNDFPILALTNSAGHALARTYTQLGTAVGFSKIASPLNSYIGASSYITTVPEPMNSEVLLTEVLIKDNNTIRGVMPGLYSPITNLYPADRVVLDDVPAIGTLVFIRLGYGAGIDRGRVGINITGPWR